jgi:hypothetical protein
MVIIMSVFLFFVDQVGLITEFRKRNSWTYKHIAPVGPLVINLVTLHTQDGKNLFEAIKNRYDAIEIKK